MAYIHSNITTQIVGTISRLTFKNGNLLRLNKDNYSYVQEISIVKKKENHEDGDY